MIAADQLRQVIDWVGEWGPGDAAVERLRKALPDLHFTCCMDDDVSGARPVHESATFNVYLVDGRDHCLCFTGDADVATGLVIAEVEAD